jgi:hypothetical protein
MLIQPSTTGLWLDFAQTQWLGNYWSPVCWHIILSSTKSPCCLLVEIHQPYLLQQCLDQGPRAICHTERSRRSGKIYKGRRNTVFWPEREILPNRHLYITRRLGLYVKSMTAEATFGTRGWRNTVQSDLNMISYRSAVYIKNTSMAEEAMTEFKLIHETWQRSTLRKMLDGLFVWIQYEIKS